MMENLRAVGIRCFCLLVCCPFAYVLQPRVGPKLSMWWLSESARSSTASNSDSVASSSSSGIAAQQISTWTMSPPNSHYAQRSAQDAGGTTVES